MDYQIVPLNLHCYNAPKRDICTFKGHLLSILSGIAEDPPKNLLGMMITQTEMMLNLLRQPTFKPDTLALENFNGTISYNCAPLGTLVLTFIMHGKITPLLHGNYAETMDGM